MLENSNLILCSSITKSTVELVNVLDAVTSDQKQLALLVCKVLALVRINYHVLKLVILTIWITASVPQIWLIKEEYVHHALLIIVSYVLLVIKTLVMFVEMAMN